MIKLRHSFLLLLPAILVAVVILYIQIRRYEPLYPNYNASTKPSEQFVPLFSEDPIIGKKQSSKTIVVFEDATCEHCKELTNTLLDLLTTNPDSFKIIWKGLSVITFPQDSTLAHEYLFCANEQGLFLPFLQEVFANQLQLSASILEQIGAAVGLQTAQLSSCLASERPTAYIEKTRALAKSLGVDAVPAVFIDGVNIPDTLTQEGWKEILSR